MKCNKCQSEISSIKGEVAAYSLWASIPLWIFLLGPLSAVFFAGLGLYLYKTHNSKTFVCPDCLEQNCPNCSKELSSKKYCNNCKIIICPLCGNQQQHEKGTTWLKASILLPVTFAVAIGLLFIDPWLVPLAYMFYVVFSAPNCRNCSEKVYLAAF